MVEEKEVKVTILPRREDIAIICGLTRADERRVDYIHNMVDTLHSLCEERVGMAEQVKPAVTFGLAEACELRDIMIENAHKYLRELIKKAREVCP